MSLLAPAAPSQVLEGGGPAEVGTLLPWESAAFAPLHHDSGPLPDASLRLLTAFGAAVVFSRDATLVKRLGEIIPTVIQRDPSPPPGAGHVSVWLADAVRELGIPVRNDEPPSLSTRPVETAELTSRLPDRFLALHPGSGSPRKNWPVERFAALADALAPQEPFALIDGPADRAVSARLASIAQRAVLARDRSVSFVAALLQRARLYVGNDSGVSHLAAAVGTPTLALFGPTDPVVWAPVGVAARTLRALDGDLERLEVRTVLDYVSGAWTSSRLMSR
ncbi:MAG TPA: glycosyltransferase family 9 protein [Vicinamibacteria bacterium]|nr:glycosyltransferase family 9 protein [Vicinamibacteria bacterium]